jgi:hypothetical protein
MKRVYCTADFGAYAKCLELSLQNVREFLKLYYDKQSAAG